MNNIPSKEEFYEALSVRHGKENQEKFRAATVAVCGLGGLGSNISICLARAGVGTLILIGVSLHIIKSILFIDSSISLPRSGWIKQRR